jgi:hypothetical protein
VNIQIKNLPILIHVTQWHVERMEWSTAAPCVFCCSTARAADEQQCCTHDGRPHAISCRIHLAQDRNRWRTLVNTVMNLRVSQKAGNFWLAEWLSASEERLCSMKLVTSSWFVVVSEHFHVLKDQILFWDGLSTCSFESAICSLCVRALSICVENIANSSTKL